MKSNEEFKVHSEKEINPIVAALEAKRLGISDRFSFKKYKRNLKWLALADVAVGISVSFEIIPQPFISIIPISFLYALFAPLYIFIRRNLSFSPINDEYKKAVIPKIISFFDGALEYKSSEGISKKEFNDSDLFDRPAAFESEDLVQGHLNGIDVRMADVRCTQSSTNRNNWSGNLDKNTKTSSSTYTVFHGLYAIARQKRNFPSRVILKSSNIITNAINNLASSFLSSALAGKIHDQLETNIIKTGNEAFDKLYAVKCVDEGVAKNLLTPAFIQLVLAFRKEIESPVDFAFFDNEIHIAFHGVNLFEGDAHKSFTEKNISAQYFGYINMTIGIAEAV
jgi:Protein of unknown function (DUF3137)